METRVMHVRDGISVAVFKSLARFAANLYVVQ